VTTVSDATAGGPADELADAELEQMIDSVRAVGEDAPHRAENENEGEPPEAAS
jgi:hypothetical protein